MRTIGIFLFLVLPSFFWGEASYHIVCVHIGKSIPSHLELALVQARLFNPNCPIVLLASEKALQDFSSCSGAFLIPLESLPKTPEHEEFRRKLKQKSKLTEGFWSYTIERFLYLYDYMVDCEVNHVFHIENDVLLYEDLGKLLPVFQEYYPGMAATFESESKGIPGFIFINKKESLQKFSALCSYRVFPGMSDMKILALFWKKYQEEIDCLPMIMESYLEDHTAFTSDNLLLRKKKRHSKHIAQFNSIFDGAAIGVFFDGLDPAKVDAPPGYLMKALFNPSDITYQWELDEKGRKVPYAVYGKDRYRINNLHIASKRLERFTSQ